MCFIIISNTNNFCNLLLSLERPQQKNDEILCIHLLRDLKNQLVLAFYWVLVETGVFEEVVVSHMPVGHTHADVDQIFSIFASKLRRMELPTFESLLIALKTILIDSQPLIVKEMLYTTDFTSHISTLLQPISGHTAFFQFKIRKENEKTKMFVKQDVLEKAWQFTSGVWLLKSPPSMINLQVSPFRTESDYGEIFASVWSKYIPTLVVKYSEPECIKIKAEWETRISSLIRLKESDFQAFDVYKLVFEDQDENNLTTSFQNRIRESSCTSKDATLTATFYPPEIKAFSVRNLVKDCSVVFYTIVKKTRPWIGLFVELFKDTMKIKVEWVKKDKKLYVLDTAYFSVIDFNTVMFVDVLRNMSYTGNRNGPYVLDAETKKQIVAAYIERDRACL